MGVSTRRSWLVPYHKLCNRSESLHDEFLVIVCNCGILLENIVQVLELLQRKALALWLYA